ncbi:MAG: AfsR/SARP family transcriptional regulator [Lachnospiraceae bacterium]
MKTTSPIIIQLLGNFSISYNDVSLNTNNLSNQLCNLISFLIINRGKSVSQESTIDAIWPEGVNNPAAALKNLVYRFRKLSEEEGFEFSRNFIISTKGNYILNPNLEYDIDIDTFVTLCKQYEQCEDSAKKATFLRKSIDCYKGDLLSTLNQKTWITPISVRYNNVYFQNLYELLDYYENAKDYEAMKIVAQQGIAVNLFEEEAHRYYLLALSNLHCQQQAINHYIYISDLFFKDLGVKLSPQTRTLYNEIAKTTQTNSTDISALKNDLNEDPDDISEAFYCELEVFKQVYRFEARSAARTGTSIFIGLFTINGASNKEPEKSARDKAMNHLHQTIRESLRKSDIFSRCSPNQYVLMLPMINFENGMVVLSRIDKKFKSTFHSKKVTLSHNLQPLDLSLFL